MAKVKLNRDYRGKATSERFFHAGDVAEVSDADALALVAEGVGQRVSDSTPANAPDTLADLSEGELRGLAEQAVRERNLRRQVWQ